MRVLLVSAAVLLAGCSGDKSGGVTKNLLLADDPQACAAVDVQEAVLKSLAAQHNELAGRSYKPTDFRSVSAVGINKDIHEVSCSADLRLARQGTEEENQPAGVWSLAYKIRPSLGDDVSFVVEATAGNGLAEATYKTDSAAKAVVEAVAPPSERGFTSAEQNLIRSAGDAWGDFRNNKDGADEKFDKLLDQLLKRNICWGKVDQVQVEYDYHRCTSSSLQKQPDPASDSDEAKCNNGDHDACLRL